MIALKSFDDKKDFNILFQMYLYDLSKFNNNIEIG